MKTRSEHWVTEPKIIFGSVMAYGISQWDIPDGGRLRREMTRSTAFNSINEMIKWAKKYGIEVEREIARWKSLEGEGVDEN